jgi:hypothetical protein
MEFFSGSKPNLISKRATKNIELMLNGNKEPSINMFSGFYENYISPNIFFFILFGILVLFLIFKYYTKEEKFNPSLPLNVQIPQVRFRDNEVKLLKDKKFVNYNDINNIDYQDVPDNIIPDIHNTQKREINTGVKNPYISHPDTTIKHPYDWPDDLISSTSNSINFMKERNDMIDNELEQIIDNDSNMLLNIEKPYM